MPGIKFTEFYTERQGRPASSEATDMERRQPSIVITGGGVTLISLDSAVVSFEDYIVFHEDSIVYRS